MELDIEILHSHIEILQCRVCMEEKIDLVYLQSKTENATELTVLDTLNFCTRLEASEDDALPQHICIQCNQDLLYTFEFIKKARTTDQILRMKGNLEADDLTEYMVTGADHDQSDENEYPYEVDTNDEDTRCDLMDALDNCPIKVKQIVKNNEDDAIAVETRVSDKSAKFSCTQCSNLFETEEVLEIHLKESHIDNHYLCYICGKTCPSSKELSVHLAGHKQHKGEKRFACRLCDKKYANRYNLQVHLASIHSHGEVPTFICSVCGKNLKTKQNLQFHQLTHTGEKNHNCAVCGKKFATSIRLKKHSRTHMEETPWVCKICGVKYENYASLKSHEHGPSGSPINTLGAKSFSCELCSKNYARKRSLEVHLASVHSIGEIPKFLCSVCGKNLRTNQNLQLHQLTHTGERNHECDMCGKKFATSIRLRKHIRTHTGEKPWACKICGMKFRCYISLKSHEHGHTGEKPYKCKICGERFSKYTIRKTHMLSHTEKTFECLKCDEKFSREIFLKRHEREQHTEDRPFACDKCPNTYKLKSDLSRHLDRHLGIRYECDVCSKAYAEASALKMHMFSHSEEKRHQCPDCKMQFARMDSYRLHLLRAHNKVLPKKQRQGNDDSQFSTSQQ